MSKTFVPGKYKFTKKNGKGRGLTSLHAGLNSDETRLLEAASLGDVVTVQKLLDKGVNASIKDSLDRTPLLGAVAKNHQQMIEILTPKCDTLDFYEALISAIRQGKATVACYLVNSPRFDECMEDVRKRIAIGNDIIRNRSENKTWRQRTSKLASRTDAYNVTLATNATPIVLAAQMNLFEVVKTLLDKGERITMPDETGLGHDPYFVAKTRLETYRGLTSEAYVSLANSDPIRRAMELGQSLRQNAIIERYFSIEYNELADELSSYLVKLMDHVRNTRELDTIINHTIDGSEDKFATLKVAVDYGEMKFISHPACQQELEMNWYGPLLKQSNSLLRMMLFWVGYCAIYPILSVIYMIYPHSKIEGFMRIPYVKFVGHVFMYFVLIVMITQVTSTQEGTVGYLQSDKEFGVLYSYFANYSHKYSMDIGDRLIIRGIRFSYIQIMIILWILGLLWQELKQIYINGFKLHFSETQNNLDFIIVLLYTAAFTLYGVTYAKLHNALEYFEHGGDAAWTKLIHHDPTAMYHYYFVIGDRMVWEPSDPFVVYECIFSAANFMTFGRISAFLPASNVLGPLQIGIYKIMKDVLKFLFILSIMLTPFWVAMVNTYWYYNASTLRNSSMFDEYNSFSGKVTASVYFTTLPECLHTLFWSMFGYADGSYTSIEPFNQPVTYWAGSILFGGYHIIVVIVCVNLLIALMTRTFDDVSQHEDVEWKYARTRLFLEYIEEGRTLAAPFNLIPSVKSIIKLIKKPYKYCKKKSNVSEPQPDVHMSNVVLKLGIVHGRFYPNRGVGEKSIDTYIDNDAASEVADQKTAYEAVIIEIIDRLIDATLDDQEENKQ